jgi:large subunit ribosomal protein L17
MVAKALRSTVVRTLAAQLLTHGRVETTLPRAKKLQIVADKLVTVSKKSTIGAKQQVRAFLRSEALTQKVFGEMSSHYENRSGGYTMLRVTRTRSGDAAVMATVQYVKP